MTQWRGYAVYWEPSSCCRGCMGCDWRVRLVVISYDEDVGMRGFLRRPSSIHGRRCLVEESGARSENYDSRHTRAFRRWSLRDLVARIPGAHADPVTGSVRITIRHISRPVFVRCVL